jgi:flagellar L-ring protein precursor FlgH
MPKAGGNQMKCRLVFPAVALAALLMGSDAATAQNNSLFGGRSKAPPAAVQPAAPAQPAPTSQPTNAAPAATPESARPAARQAAADARLATKPNAYLLRVSPFAVAAPEPEKIKVQDTITIIVSESKTATTDSKLESKKDWTLDTALKNWIRLSDKDGVVPEKFPHGNPQVTFNYNNDYKGDGTYDRKDSLTTRITATVIDVKPNGNLVLCATKKIESDDEGYTMTLTGVCRTKDVSPQNTVLSTQLADPEIIVKHCGATRDATQRGWVMRALDFLKPF